MAAKDRPDLEPRFDPPPDWGPGSKGSAVRVINEILYEMARQNNIMMVEGFLPDGDYGLKTTEMMRRYQEFLRVNSNGRCDLQTQAAMLKISGLDLQVLVRRMGGTTCFVQPDGTKLWWRPGHEATTSEEEANGWQ